MLFPIDSIYTDDVKAESRRDLLHVFPVGICHKFISASPEDRVSIWLTVIEARGDMVSTQQDDLSNATAKERKLLRERISGGVAATCFACFLSIYSNRLPGHASVTAARLFWVAIPTLVFNLIAIAEVDRKRYQFGWLTGWIPVIGAFAGVGGIACFIWPYDHLASLSFLGLSFGLGYILMQAERKASKTRSESKIVS